ncbi:MAG: WbqC family protein [Candidatus Omnitrophota bacterium]
MIISIHQPQYLPWLGYFDKIDRSDMFVFLDDVQFKKNEWQNRNKIKTSKDWQWVSVPVMHKFPQQIRAVTINNDIDWPRQHLNALIINYNKAPYFGDYIDFFKTVYSERWTYLSELNISIIKSIVKILGIKTKLVRSCDLKQPGLATEHLINICKNLGADTYLSGEGGRLYLETEKFKKQGIELIFQDFRHPRYKQLYEKKQPFIENLSIVDLLFNQGKESLSILRKSRCRE